MLTENIRALLASAFLLETRFKAIDTVYVKDKPSGSTYAYLRIRNCQIIEGSST